MKVNIRLNRLFQFNKYRVCLGVLLAAFVFSVCKSYYSVRAGAMFAVLFIATSFVYLDIRNRGVQYCVNFLWSVIMVTAICMFPSVVMLEAFLFPKLKYILWNICCVACVVSVIFAVTMKWKLSVGIATFALYMLSTINYFVFQFRGKEVNIMDIFSLGTALSVADSYEMSVHSLMAYSWILLLFVMFGGQTIPAVQIKACKKNRAWAIAASICMILSLSFGIKEIPIQSWGRSGTTENGYYLNFWLGIRDARIVEPDGYDPKMVAEYEHMSENGGVNNTPILSLSWMRRLRTLEYLRI